MTVKPVEADEDEAADSGEPLDLRVSAYAKIGVPIATLALTMVVGATLGPPPAVLVLAGGALVGVIATFWASLRTLLGETRLAGADAYALGAPRAEEEQKRAVLRAMKDLEFERSVGKISDDDYQVLLAKYRTEAKRLLKILDTAAQPRRDQVEALVNKRLRRAGLLEGGAEKAGEPRPSKKKKAEAQGKARDEAPKAEAPTAGAREKVAEGEERTSARRPAAPLRARKTGAGQQACAACGAQNDADAIFCKKCGKRCADEAEDEPDEDEA